MKNTREKKSHEKVISRVYVDDTLDDLALSALGMFNTPIEKLTHFFDVEEEIYMHKDILRPFDKDDVKKLPDLKLNLEIFEADTDWVLKDDGNFGFYENDQDDYIARIQKAIDNIYPNNKTADKNLVPITILLPNVDPFDIEGLEGSELEFTKNDYEQLDGVSSYSYWQFITLKNESDGESKGFQELAEDRQSFFGLRLFLALKALGIVKTSQYEKNAPKIFSEILESTPLKEHFELLNKEIVTKHKSLIVDLNLLLKKLEKLVKEYDGLSIEDNIFSSINDHRIAKRKHLSDEINKIESSIENIRDEIDEIIEFIKADNEKSNLYYALPIEDVVSLDSKKFDLDPDHNFVIPTLDTSLNAPKFEMNKLPMNKGNPAPLFMRRMRFMLTYLFPMTCGTAITFYIKKESDEQQIKAPLLILPEAWDELAMALKEHNPKEELPEYSDEDELEFRKACVETVHEKLWGRKSTFMRSTVPITDTSEVDVLKAKKKPPK